MNRMFPSTAEAVLFRLSDNAERFQSEEGSFKVTYHGAQKTFPTLLDAFLFYITLDEEADLWSVSTSSVLIERKVKLYLN
jgi:hypothetical protein